MKSLYSDTNKFLNTFHELTKIGLTEEGVMRLALNNYDIIVRKILVELLTRTNTNIKYNDAGNIIGIIESKDDEIIAIGSHLNSVPYGGKYDGFYGVMAGLEILRSIKGHNLLTNHSLELIDFTNEEGSRFQPSLLGSGLTTGVFNTEFVYSRKDKNNITFLDAL